MDDIERERLENRLRWCNCILYMSIFIVGWSLGYLCAVKWAVALADG